MLHKLLLYSGDGYDPYHNLAVEEYLLRAVCPDVCLLYLWQNQRTVVIGRNQSAFDECRVAELESDGGRLARRLSGGGAVYHDLDNLNFTFITRHSDYDVERQTEVILRAVRALGVPAGKNGRNDLTADGRKFSGHAYYRSGDSCYHHGTLMVNVQLDELTRYLRPAADKLQSKGVRSVRSRVVNLREFCPALSIAELRQALVAAFGAVYGLPLQTLSAAELDAAAIAAGERRFAADDWRYGPHYRPGALHSARFDWGGVRLHVCVENGCYGELSLFSDGLEADFLHEAPQLLRGCAVERSAILARLLSRAQNEQQRTMAQDIAAVLLNRED